MISQSEIIDKTLHLQVSPILEAKDKHVLVTLLRETLCQPINQICLNFTNVKCVSSSAVNALFQELRKYYPEDVKIVAGSPPEFIRELLELTGTNRQLVH